MSDRWPATGAGHTGFTGTSLAFDPESRIWCVLLTNAVLLGRDNRARQLRRELHAAVAAEFGVAAHLNTGDEGTDRGSRITA
jgi:CubicO group peptidase (beta-lactamase class C family)